MNAGTEGALPHHTNEMLAICAQTPSTTHIQELRRARFDPKLIGELADSIKQVGILQPILARRSQANGRSDRFEIVAGERRFLAGKKAGLTHIPATLRDLSDEQVLEVQLIENLQREDLHALEEAEGYEELMKLKKVSADDVAGMVGKSRTYVFSRTKLLALGKDMRRAFYAGELDFSKALQIARIQDHEQQAAAWKSLKEEMRYGDVSTAKEVATFVRDNFLLKLKDAPFDTGDATLVPKAGSCQACPKRSGNQGDIFGDVKEKDLCTDVKCFDEKRAARFAVEVRKLENAGKKVIGGDAAKKILPHWRTNSGNDLGSSYVALDSYDHNIGAKVKDVLPDDFVPTLVQHPGTGKIIEAASAQALTKARLQQKGGKTRRSSAPKAKKAKGPDVDEQLLERLVKLIYEKAPKTLGKSHLQLLATRLLHHLNTRTEERAVVSKQFGWSSKGMTSGGYYSSAKLPAEALKLDERGLVMLMLQLCFLADRYQRQHVLGAFGINEQKTRELIIEERKAAARAAREASKKARAAKKK